jgi:hypothetical protein
MYTLTDMAMILMVILYLIFITNIILGGYYDDYGQYVEGELENEELEYFEDDYEDIEDEFDDEEYRKLEMEGHLFDEFDNYSDEYNYVEYKSQNNNKTNPINLDDKLKGIRERNSNKSNNINNNVTDNNLHTVNDEEKKLKQSKEKQTLHDILVYKSFNFLG